MKKDYNGWNSNRMLFGMHFVFHIIIGLIASGAGLVVIFTTGKIGSSFALVGAGIFAILNGWQGCKELGIGKVNQCDSLQKRAVDN